MAPRRRVPSRVPDGTRYVIEGEPGQEGELRIISRYLIFPDGSLSISSPDRSGSTSRRGSPRA